MLRRNGISHSRLMRESTDRIQIALQSGRTEEQLVATRVLESPSLWQQWESEHSGLMRVVAVDGFQRTQAAILKRTSLRLLERKALFEYLREKSIRGDMRARIFAYFHPARSFQHAVIAEHGVYVRKACSYLCTTHVGTAVVQDVGFFDPMRHYEQLYRDYFRLFCDTHFGNEPPPQSDLLPLLKYELDECRKAIMNPDREVLRQQIETHRREAAGDTVRMRTLAPPGAPA